MKIDKTVRAAWRSTLASRGAHTTTDDETSAEENLRLCLDAMDEMEIEAERLSQQLEELWAKWPTAGHAAAFIREHDLANEYWTSEEAATAYLRGEARSRKDMLPVVENDCECEPGKPCADHEPF